MNKPPMPDQPKTKELPAVVPIDTSNAAIMREVRKQGVALETVTNALLEFREEHRQEMTEVREKLAGHSVQVKGESKTNLEQDAAIATLVVRTEAIETNQAAAAKERADTAAMVKEVRDTVVGVATNKRVIFVGKVIFAIAVAYSAAHGLKVLP